MLSCVGQSGAQSGHCTQPRPSLCSGYPILAIPALLGFYYKKTALFLISTVKQRGCSHENVLLHCLIKQGHAAVQSLVLSRSCPWVPLLALPG